MVRRTGRRFGKYSRRYSHKRSGRGYGGRNRRNRLRFRRRFNKPELKYVEVQTNQVLTTTTPASITVSPITIPTGAQQSQRIGNEIRSKALKFRFNAFPNAPVLTPLLQECQFLRVVLWTSRTTSADAVTYMGGLNILSHLDYNLVTVFMDRVYSMSFRYDTPVLTTPPTINNTSPSSRFFKKGMAFNRKINFRGNLSTVIDDKDVVYVTYIKSSAVGDLAISCNCRITYIDP